MLQIRTFTAARCLQQKENQQQADGAAPDRVQAASDTLQRVVGVARQSWNDLVGYTDIEKNRAKVADQEELISTRKLDLAAAREAHRAAVDKHAGTLRETRDLLARKDEWTGEDAARFAALHTATRAAEADEKAARRALAAAELALERDTERLSARIGAVYQAESMYNAKVLQVKTWWTWALMVFNVSVFVFNVYLIQLGLNPRYRRDMDLSDAAVAKIKAALVEKSVAEVQMQSETAQVPVVLVPLVGDVAASDELRVYVDRGETVESIKTKVQAQTGHAANGLHLYHEGSELDGGIVLSDLEPGPDGLRLTFSANPVSDAEFASLNAQPAPANALETVRSQIQSLFSPTPVTWRMSDVTALALQSAAAGATAAAVVLLSLQRR